MCVGGGGSVWLSITSRDLREEKQLDDLTNLATKASTYNLFFQSKINNLVFRFLFNRQEGFFHYGKFIGKLGCQSRISDEPSRPFPQT